MYFSGSAGVLYFTGEDLYDFTFFIADPAPYAYGDEAF